MCRKEYQWCALTIHGGYVHACHYEDAASGLRYTAFPLSGNMIPQTEVVTPCGLVSCLALVVDAQDQPHLAFRAFDAALDRSRWSLYYAVRTATGWHVEMLVEDTHGWGGPTYLLLDSAGQPHIGYLEATSLYLRYVHRDADGWQHEKPAITLANLDFSMGLTAADQPYFLYHTASPVGGLVCARLVAGQWQEILVSAPADMLPALCAWNDFLLTAHWPTGRRNVPAWDELTAQFGPSGSQVPRAHPFPPLPATGEQAHD